MAFTAAFILLFCGSCLLALSTAAPHKYVELAYSDYERKCRYHACSELQAIITTDVASSLLYTHGTVHCHVVASKFNCVNFKMLIYAIYLCTMQVQQFHRCMQSLHMPINVSEEHVHTMHLWVQSMPLS